jgi:hypothetical protein
MADEAAILEPLTELLRGFDTGARCTAIFSAEEMSSSAENLVSPRVAMSRVP